MRVSGEQQATRINAFAFEHVEFGDEHRGVDNDTVSNHGRDMGVQDPGGNELQREGLAIHDDGVASVVTALIAHDKIGTLGEIVDETTFTFITPLGSNNYRSGHGPSLSRTAASRREQTG